MIEESVHHLMLPVAHLRGNQRKLFVLYISQLCSCESLTLTGGKQSERCFPDMSRFLTTQRSVFICPCVCFIVSPEAQMNIFVCGTQKSLGNRVDYLILSLFKKNQTSKKYRQNQDLMRYLKLSCAITSTKGLYRSDNGSEGILKFS